MQERGITKPCHKTESASASRGRMVNHGEMRGRIFANKAERFGGSTAISAAFNVRSTK